MVKDACAVMDYYNKKNGLVYIIVVNYLSVDCDCFGNPEKTFYGGYW